MRIIGMIAIGSFSLLISIYATAYECSPPYHCGQADSYIQAHATCTPGSKHCGCTDPACNNTEGCLSKGDCCEAFGNIGGR